MTAFLKIDDCKSCHRSLPWEWVAAIRLGGKALAGTGVWRSQLTGGLCSACLADLESERQRQQHALTIRKDLVQLLGGEKSYREFTLGRFEITPGSQLAYERSKNFNPAIDNLYLWGPCGVGKTHLAYAIARTCFEQTLSVTILLASQLSRKVRMKEPEKEQATIDELVRAETLVVDDIGIGNETPFYRQILQEVLDGRDFADRAGLVITSKYSLSALAEKMNDDTVASRLAGLCSVVEIRGTDHRVSARRSNVTAAESGQGNP